MTANSQTQIQATVLMYVCYTVWINIYYNSPAMAKFLVTQHNCVKINKIDKKEMLKKLKFESYRRMR
jgi:hypothetical protein